MSYLELRGIAWKDAAKFVIYKRGRTGNVFLWGEEILNCWNTVVTAKI